MSLLFACGFTISALISAIAIDAAALYHERRQMQAGVDLAAIAAVADPARATGIVRSVLTEARLLDTAGIDGLNVRVGHFDRSITDIAARFQPGAMPYNAVEVTLARRGDLHFAASFAPPPHIITRGLAANHPEVSFSIGSRLASLNGGLVNNVLSSLLGTSVSLNAVDYRALADARVDALGFLDALAQQLGVTAGSYDALLAMRAPSGAIAGALATLTNGAAKTALSALAGPGRGHSVPIGKLIDLDHLGRMDIGSAGTAGLGLNLSVLDLLSGAATLAEGNKQVALGLSADVPNLTKLDLALGIGEPPQGGGWFAMGPQGTVLRTAQVRLRIRAALLGGPILLGAGVKLPIWLDAAHSEAMVTAITCPSPSAPKGAASIAVRPGALRLALGEMSDPALANFGIAPSTAPVKLIDVLLLKISGAAQVDIAQTTPIRLDFSSADIAAGRVKTASTQTIPSSLLGSLFGNLDLDINILGLGLSSPRLIAQALGALLSPLGPVLDLTIDTLLNLLGLGIGEADIRVHGVRCSGGVLVG